MPVRDRRPLASQELAGASANTRVATEPSCQSKSFYCCLSLPPVTRMEIKVKNINGCQLLPLLFILLASISKVRSQVRFSALPGPAVPRRVQKALRQRHDCPSNEKLSGAKKPWAAVLLPSKRRGDAISKGDVVGVLACADRWSGGERLAYVRGGGDRARKRVAVGNRGVETASLMAWPLSNALEIACHMWLVSGSSFPE